MARTRIAEETSRRRLGLSFSRPTRRSVPIAEARRAVTADSANVYLNTHLAETMRRKVDLLRQAAALVAATS